MNNYNVDSTSDHPSRISTAGDLKDYHEGDEIFIDLAREELDYLYRILGPAGYVVLLSNKYGVTIDHRGEPTVSMHFGYWRTWIDGAWSEVTTGTYRARAGLVPRRAATIHQAQHPHSRHIGLSCSVAPIFDGRGELVGALDISSIDPTLSEHSHALAGALVIESSRAIEERCFREQFRRHWIVAAALPDVMGGAMLFAVDRDYRIVGADLNARVLLLRIQAVGDVGVSFWTLFERDDRSFRGKDYGCDITVRLVPAGSTEASPALITPPEAPAVNWPNADSTRFHCRPRLNILASVQRTAMLPRSRGGLSPKVFRRVQEYIDAHINENIDLEVLAAIAGLSVHHFARAFRKSAGLPPHGYVMHRRLDKARDLLICTDRALADIALAAGFSDQSHLARHFQQSFGVSPRIFRYSYR